MKYLISLENYFPIIIDKLTYAGNKKNISQINEDCFDLVEGDICDEQLILIFLKIIRLMVFFILPQKVMLTGQ